MSNIQSPHQLGTNIFFTQSPFHECRCSLKTESGASLVSDWAGYHRPSKSGPKIPKSCRPGARMGWWGAWQSYDDGIKVVSKSERWHFCRPQANIGQGNGWALPTHERRKVFYYWSWYFLRSFTSFHAHTNTEMPSQWSSAVVPGSLFTALRRTSRCCFSEKSQRCLTESSQTNWLTSSYNVLKMTQFLKAEKGIPVWKAQLMANIGFRFEDRFLLSCVISPGQIILRWAVEQEKDCLVWISS